MSTLRTDAQIVVKESIAAVLPEKAVINVLIQKDFLNDVAVVAIGKAAWNMAKAASGVLGNQVKQGLVVTKYNHSKGTIPGFEIIEAGHPVPDENSVLGAEKALELMSQLPSNTEILFLVSGGGSALFEKPLDGISLIDIQTLTDKLLSCGADIVEINTIRKRLSAVKAGRFAKKCGSRKIYTVVLSDVVGDKLDAIASGPAYSDSSTSSEAFEIIEKYKIEISEQIKTALAKETPKTVENCETVIAGNVTELCNAAALSSQKLGYQPLVLSTSLDCEAKEAGKLFASMARDISKEKGEHFPQLPCAIITGGETIVHVKGKGKGGRNQEAALSAAINMDGLENVLFFSIGSDGTDGPTDAAGGMVDGNSANSMRKKGTNPTEYLENNDSYKALETSNDLIITGATGTNVNDLMVLLIKNKNNLKI